MRLSSTLAPLIKLSAMLLTLALTACSSTTVIIFTPDPPTAAATNVVQPTTLPAPTDAPPPTATFTLTPTVTQDLNATFTPIPFTPSGSTVLVTATPLPGPIDFSALPRYQNEACGLAFVYPQDWEVMTVTIDFYPHVGCAVALRPLTWEQTRQAAEIEIGAHAFSIAMVALPFTEAAGHGFFVEENGQWFVVGRQDIRTDAQLIQAGPRLMLRGRGLFGVFFKNAGGYAGLAEGERAVVTEGGNRSIILEEGPRDELLEGTTAVLQAFELVLQSLEFLPATP